MIPLIQNYLDQLLNTFGRVAPPIDSAVLKNLHKQRNYAAMLGWIKNSMNLDLRVGLRVVEASEKTNPMWIELPAQMPAYGTHEFRQTRVVVNVRKELIETKPFGWVVAGFAHELSHVVLFSIGHALQDEEKAVDLTAMILGYQTFIAGAQIKTTYGRLWPAINMAFWISLGVFFWRNARQDESWSLPLIFALILTPWAISFWRGSSNKTERLGYLTPDEAKFARKHLARVRTNRLP